MSDGALAILLAIISSLSVILTALFGYLDKDKHLNVEKPTKEATVVETLTKAWANQSQTWETLKDALEKEGARLRKSRDDLEQELQKDIEDLKVKLEKTEKRVEILEEENKIMADTFIKERTGWDIERRALQATIANLKESATEVKKIGEAVEEIKKTTDKLKETGQLPSLEDKGKK
jgi:hypothetical protein